jgi:vesicle-fusing ATPase
MYKHNLAAADVDLEKLAAMTKNYTGAEIEAVCRSATSFALFKEVGKDLGQNPASASSVASGIKVDKKNQSKFQENQV